MLARGTTLALLAVLSLGLAGGAEAQDDDALDYYAAPPAGMVGAIPTLDYNYYHPAFPGGQIPARMYLCPWPVPQRVGYTYITYPPFSPHHYLWEHDARYVRYHPSGGYTITSVTWAHE